MRRDTTSAIASIGPRKQRRLVAAAYEFLWQQPAYTSDIAWRYDVVIVTPDAITHIPHAIEAW